MLEWIDFLTLQFAKMYNLLNSMVLNVGGINVGFMDVIIGFLALSIVVTVFWKGAHT